MMDNKALLIIGSPNRQGVTALMSAYFKECLIQKGWECRSVHLYDMRIEPCRGCMMCRKTGVCTICDDADLLRESMLASGMVILAAPTYFANVPGPVKTMFDRLSGAVLDGIKPRLGRQHKYALLTACTTPAPLDWVAGQSSGAIRAMKAFFGMAGMSYCGKVVYAGAGGGKPLTEKLKSKIRRLAV